MAYYVKPGFWVTAQTKSSPWLNLNNLISSVANNNLSAGSNITITGTGTVADPYIITAAGGSAPYQSYVAFLDQSGTNAPTDSVLENTLGATVTWSRLIAGLYQVSIPGGFPANKTIIFVTGGDNNNMVLKSYYITYGDDIFLGVVDSNWVNIEGNFNNLAIEIRVYP